MRLPLRRREGILSFIALKYLGLDPFEYRNGGDTRNRLHRFGKVHDDNDLPPTDQPTAPPLCWPRNDQREP